MFLSRGQFQRWGDERNFLLRFLDETRGNLVIMRILIMWYDVLPYFYEVIRKKHWFLRDGDEAEGGSVRSEENSFRSCRIMGTRAHEMRRSGSGIDREGENFPRSLNANMTQRPTSYIHHKFRGISWVLVSCPNGSSTTAGLDSPKHLDGTILSSSGLDNLFRVSSLSLGLSPCSFFSDMIFSCV